jgi:hypothetical protein
MWNDGDLSPLLAVFQSVYRTPRAVSEGAAS